MAAPAPTQDAAVDHYDVGVTEWQGQNEEQQEGNEAQKQEQGHKHEQEEQGQLTTGACEESVPLPHLGDE